MYALIDYIGTQILIKEGEKVKIPFLDKKIGSKVLFENVLFFDDGKNKKIGNPYLKSFSFSGKIASHEKEKKVIVFKKKRRKGHQKKNGHQQQFTYVTVDKFSKPKTAKKTSDKTKATSKPKKVTKKEGDK
jgi:large subunit ribosomal protein L21